MEKKEQQRGIGGLSSGFLLGVVVGVIITLLLTTKRGKRIVKMITEEGMSKISHWEDLFTDIEDDQQAQSQEPKLSPVELNEEAANLEELQGEKEEASLKKKEIAKTAKRFFRGIPRHGVN